MIDAKASACVDSDYALAVENLKVDFTTGRGHVRVVEGISYNVKRGEVVALVGESGCGKSVSSLALMRLLPRTAKVQGRVLLSNKELLSLPDHEMRRVRGRDIAMIFQEPMTSLNPVLTIGLQIMESLFAHLKLDRSAAIARAIELLDLVGIPRARQTLDVFPHQLSGGMRQRVMIAIALACDPSVIIADEPTTALDVTIQAQILQLMKDIADRLNIALVLITHNLGIVARYADRVNVMYAGQLVEQGTVDDIFIRPQQPYTLGLIRSVPRLDRPRKRKLETIEGVPPRLYSERTGCRFANRCEYRIDICNTSPQLVPVGIGHKSRCFRSAELGQGEIIEPNRPASIVPSDADVSPPGPIILSINRAEKRFGARASSLFGRKSSGVVAVNGVSLSVRRGQTLGLVGESGCGKSTLARLILQLETLSGGTIKFEERDISRLRSSELLLLRRDLQVIFQDPYLSLNPRMTVEQILSEPIRVHNLRRGSRAIADRVRELLDQVGLSSEMARRYPHELSGGQRQRVGIARAIAMEPRLIVCDEPVSALDVSVQGQIINLLVDLQEKLDLTYLFIAHDLAVVRHISTRVAVMYLGRIVEIAERDDLFDHPLHPYTQALLASVPIPDPQIERMRQAKGLSDEIRQKLVPLEGCVFQPRCPLATEQCKVEVPIMRELRPGHFVSCHALGN